MAATPPLWIPGLRLETLSAMDTPIAWNDGLGGWGGIRPGAIAIFLRKMLSPWGFKAHCVFAFGESRNVDGYPYRLE